jgi:hypothetical protein
VKVTEPAGMPPTALTRAVNVTRESRVIDAEDDVSTVLVVITACFNAAGVDARELALHLTSGAVRDRRCCRADARYSRPAAAVDARQAREARQPFLAARLYDRRRRNRCDDPARYMIPM